MSEITIIPYSLKLKDTWDKFVESSKNGTFLFFRDYMDYHSDRFKDTSLLIYRKGKLYALLPGCIKEEIFYSHAGLTYGGLIMDKNATSKGVLDVFRELITYLKDKGILQIVYKAIPYIYSTIPAEEDLYALFRNNAILSGRNVSSVIHISDIPKPYYDRKTALNRAIKAGLQIKEDKDYDSFWEILTNNLLSKYFALPVHTLEEIKLLISRFPDNIKLFTSYKDNKIVGGVMCYVTSTTIHAQYISANPEGKKCGAIDFIIFWLLQHKVPECYPYIKYFDLGTSNLNNGKWLNESLIYQKEGFGGRAVCYDTYTLFLDEEEKDDEYF